MKSRRITRLIASCGAALVSYCALPGVAQAQIGSPCLVLGSSMPPPCIVFDYKRLADTAMANAHELQKIQETVNTIREAKAATDGIVSSVRDISQLKIDLALPNVDLNTGPLLKDIAGKNGLSLEALAQQAGDALFSGVDTTTDKTEKADAMRNALAADGNAEAFAYGVQNVSETMAANDRYADLSRKACKSKDLRTDWAVNSAIKLETMNARARQSYLLTAFLRAQAANNARNTLRTALPQGYKAGTVATIPTDVVAEQDQSEKVRKLQDLFSKAQVLLGSLQVVLMTQSVQETLHGVIADYQSTTARKTQAMSRFQSLAQSWVRHSDKGSASGVINTALANLNTMDQQLASLRSQQIENLSGAFAQRNINVQEMLSNDVDPRQFVGTWTDPLKADNTLNLANTLLKGTLDGPIKGDDDNNEFRQILYDYHDVMLEEAWKKVYADEARDLLKVTDSTIAEENQRVGKDVNAPNITSDLEGIVAQANALGQEIGVSSDAGAKERAAAILEQLQQIVGGGTALPAVDVSAG